MAFQFFDDKLLMTLDIIRDHLGPYYINNWDMKEEKRRELNLPLYDERGLRCIQCSIVVAAFKAGILYCSSHLRGQGSDGDIEGLTADKVRLWCVANKNILPFPIRLEKRVSWVHLDTMDAGKGKVYLFI
jgi:hypothetical protein